MIFDCTLAVSASLRPGGIEFPTAALTLSQLQVLPPLLVLHSHEVISSSSSITVQIVVILLVGKQLVIGAADTKNIEEL